MTFLTPQEMVQEAGGITRLAGLLSVTRNTIYTWLRQSKIPEVYQYAFQAKRPRKRRSSPVIDRSSEST